MTEKRKSFLIYIDTLPLFDELNDEDELSLCRAINHYHRNLPIELTAVARPLFRIFQAQFERDNERYAARCEKNRASVLKRYEQQQSNTDEYGRIRTNTNVNDRIRTLPIEIEIEKVILSLFPLSFPPIVQKRRRTISGGKLKLCVLPEMRRLSIFGFVITGFKKGQRNRTEFRRGGIGFQEKSRQEQSPNATRGF